MTGERSMTLGEEATLTRSYRSYCCCGGIAGMRGIAGIMGIVGIIGFIGLMLREPDRGP